MGAMLLQELQKCFDYSYSKGACTIFQPLFLGYHSKSGSVIQLIALRWDMAWLGLVCETRTDITNRGWASRTLVGFKGHVPSFYLMLHDITTFDEPLPGLIGSYIHTIKQSKSDVQVCHQRLSSAFDLLLIFLCSLIQTLTPPPNNYL